MKLKRLWLKLKRLWMNMNKELKQYYESVDIAPVNRMNSYDEMFHEFGCGQKDNCRDVCHQGYIGQNHIGGFCFSPPIVGQGVHVSLYYQDRQYNGVCIPRILVLSLSRPQPDPLADLLDPPVAQAPVGGGNQHWPKTLETVRSLLYPVIGNQDDRLIEKLFVHVRTAKCCSNYTGGRQEPDEVYENCGVYLPGELSILKPDVIVTQGGNASWAAEQYAFTAIQQVNVVGLNPCVAHIAELQDDNHTVYWLPMTFPTNAWGHMRRWEEEAGPIIELDPHVVRGNLVHYGEEIMEFIENR